MLQQGWRSPQGISLLPPESNTLLKLQPLHGGISYERCGFISEGQEPHATTQSAVNKTQSRTGASCQSYLRVIFCQHSRDYIPCFGLVSVFTLRPLFPFQTCLFPVIILVFHVTFHFKYRQLKCMFMLVGIISGSWSSNIEKVMLLQAWPLPHVYTYAFFRNMSCCKHLSLEIRNIRMYLDLFCEYLHHYKQRVQLGVAGSYH